MKIQRIEECLLKPKQIEDISILFQKCFPAYPGNRHYYKQLPNFRYLARDNRKLVGHIAIEHRVIAVGDEIFRIFGITDVCVDPDFQSQKIGSLLLEELKTFADQCTIDFIVLNASQKDLYKKNKYIPIENVCRWLIINNHKTFGVGQRVFSDSMMILPLKKNKWPKGVIDLLGHVF